MKKLLRKLKIEDLKWLADQKGVRVFESDMDFLKPDEVPPAALIVVEGEADVMKEKEEFLQLSPGYVVGLDQLKANVPANICIRAKKNLKAILLDPMDCLETSPFFPLLQGLTLGT